MALLNCSHISGNVMVICVGEGTDLSGLSSLQCVNGVRAHSAGASNGPSPGPGVGVRKSPTQKKKKDKKKSKRQKNKKKAKKHKKKGKKITKEPEPILAIVDEGELTAPLAL